MHIKTFRILVLTVLLGTLAPCAPATTIAPTLKSITAQLSWTNQAEFAGLYAADQLGYFAQEGLEVSFLEGGPAVDFIIPVVNGTAQFGIAQPADVILARADGKPVRSIAAIYRRSPIVFFALAGSGITRPQDFAGKKIRSTTTADQTLQAMMARIGVDKGQYQTVYLPSDISLFASGEVPIWVGFINGLALEVKRAGYGINIIFPDDYGIHFYGDVLITTDELIAKDPGLVRQFTKAALKGWTYAVEHPGETGALVQKYNPSADPGLESEKMTASIPFIYTGESYIGQMEPEAWSVMEATLRKLGVLAKPLEAEQIYTLRFLEEIYGK